MKPFLFVTLLALVFTLGCQSDPAPGEDSPATSQSPAPSQAPPAAENPSSEAEVPKGLEAFRPLIGLSVEAAEQWLKENPTPNPDMPTIMISEVRAEVVDGEGQIVTMDLSGTRLNVSVDKGLISELRTIG